MKMWFVEVILSIINQAYIIAREIHMKSDISMVCGVIIHQWHKKTNDIYQTE